MRQRRKMIPRKMDSSRANARRKGSCPMTSKLLFASVLALFLAAPLLPAADDPPTDPDLPKPPSLKNKPKPPTDKPADKKAESGDKKPSPPEKKAELPQKKTDPKDDGDLDPKEPEKDPKQVLARVSKNMRTSEDR